MEIIPVNFDENEKVYIIGFGMETDSSEAHWGRGSRNVTIIHYVLSGVGFCNGVKISEGEGFFLPRNQVHEYHSSEDNPWTYFWVVLKGDGADDFAKGYIEPDKNGKFVFSFTNKLKEYLDSFFMTKGSMSQIRAMGYFLVLMSYHQEKETNKEPVNKYVRDAKEYMENNLHRRLSIYEIAEYLHISDRYLYNLFTEYEGISPKQYFSNLKLKYALKFLEEGNMNVTEIANSLGFSDLFSFSRFFASRMGCSPIKYKNMR